MDYLKEKVRVIIRELESLMERERTELTGFSYIEADYKTTNEPPVGEWKPWNRDLRMKGMDQHFWFRTSFTAPEAREGQTLYFSLRTSETRVWDAVNPQGILYLNGEMIQGLDVNHTTAMLEPGKQYDLVVYMYTSLLLQLEVPFLADLVWIDDDTEGLYYDLKVPFDASKCMEKGCENYWKILSSLEQAVQLVDLRNPGSSEYYEGIRNARTCLKEEFYGKVCGQSGGPLVHLVGHTHIDVAWLWTLEQTCEKAQRSFSTVLRLMEQYPEYKFMSSQPQLYAYVKDQAPEIYEQIRERIKEGRWEADGAMWLEADCNLSSGESLVRQILHGKRFMKEEFGVDSTTLWLPDVFGYSAALPQILKKTGVDNFFTTKISWSETNKMPYDAFYWEGIDGSEIFTCFGTARDLPKPGDDDNCTTYVGSTEPIMIRGSWERFQQKEYSNDTLITYGFGDGGGGPTRHMLETARRTCEGIPGIPKTTMSTYAEYLQALRTDFEETVKRTGRAPKWVGELYLEYHRGTYTSQANNKKNNRRSELSYQEAETLGVLAWLFAGTPYEKKKLYDAWQVILLNQFHDIIPGSSIHEVYEHCDRDYAKLLADSGSMTDTALEELAKRVDSADGIFVYNPTGFERNGIVHVNGTEYQAENVPAFGWKVIPRSAGVKDEDTRKTVLAAAVKNADGAEEIVLENSMLRIILQENGKISSLYDKRADRELAMSSEPLNELRIYEDFPRDYDAWELSAYYKDKSWTVDQVSASEIVTENGRAGVRLVKTYDRSVITQTIWMYENSSRIDFETEIDWHQRHQILKAEFPLDLHVTQAAYDIQFGHLYRPTHRNTSWDAAKFEVCAHKWADLSENDYGVSLLNDCKYGYSALGSTLTLSLLKGATYPDPEADQGHHSFTYSLYPHMGSLTEGGTIQNAYELNQPLKAVCCSGDGGMLPQEFSLLSCDSPNVIVETIKQAEDDEDLIVRFYEAYDRRCEAEFRFGVPVESVTVCDMMEHPLENGGISVSEDHSFRIPVHNFEIVTLKVKLK